MQPLQYQESLKKGERKKAFVDITNPSSQATKVQFQVQGFKQIDDKGNLVFYDDERLRSGILLDFDQAEIPAKKTLRLFFIADGTKLPTGDVFAAIFAYTKSNAGIAAPSVRIGTLLILTNDTPGSRSAEITDFTIPFFQFGSHLSGSYTVKNTANQNEATGFYPAITVAIQPFKSQYEQPAKLLFAGVSRSSSFTIEESRLGFYKVSVAHGGSIKERWVFMATGVWLVRAIVGTLCIALLVTGLAVWRRLRGDQAKHDK
jgi:hypothetical protein